MRMVGAILPAKEASLGAGAKTEPELDLFTSALSASCAPPHPGCVDSIKALVNGTPILSTPPLRAGSRAPHVQHVERDRKQKFGLISGMASSLSTARRHRIVTSRGRPQPAKVFTTTSLNLTTVLPQPCPGSRQHLGAHLSSAQRIRFNE